MPKCTELLRNGPAEQGASYAQLKDYGIFSLTGSPKDGQTLQQAKQILLDQITLLKQGAFDEQLIKAIIDNMKLSALKSFDNNDDRADDLVEAFTLNKGRQWDKKLSTTDRMSQINKKEIVAFAKRFFQHNYVAVLKHKGKKEPVQKVNKPQISAIQTNTQAISAFAQKVMSEPTKPIIPKFLDYQRDLHFSKAGIARVITVQNNENELFKMTYHFNFGDKNNKILPISAKYLAFLGTDKYTAERINRMFYNIACNYSLSVRGSQTDITISGLQENFDQAVALLEQILADCKPNQAALSQLKQQLLTQRKNAKENKGLILAGLTAYAQFGADNPFNYVLSTAQIKALKAEDLIDLLHNLCHYQHSITYYGPQNASEFTREIIKLHKLPLHFLPAPKEKVFAFTKMDKSKVYFTNYPMVQTEIYWVRNTINYDPNNAATIATFNHYFGEGMGSIVSQRIRESQALAYSTFAVAWVPDSKEKKTAILAYIGTQADKMNDAILSMDGLLKELPLSEKRFAIAKNSIIKGLTTSSITKDEIIRAYFADKKLGLTVDSRKLKYKALQNLRLNDIKNYFNQNISGLPFSYCILGDEKNVNNKSLEKLGPVTKLSLQQIFGY